MNRQPDQLWLLFQGMSIVGICTTDDIQQYLRWGRISAAADRGYTVKEYIAVDDFHGSGSEPLSQVPQLIPESVCTPWALLCVEMGVEDWA